MAHRQIATSDNKHRSVQIYANSLFFVIHYFCFKFPLITYQYSRSPHLRALWAAASEPAANPCIKIFNLLYLNRGGFLLQPYAVLWIRNIFLGSVSGAYFLVGFRSGSGSGSGSVSCFGSYMNFFLIFLYGTLPHPATPSIENLFNGC
jgi:hypothetical protein